MDDLGRSLQVLLRKGKEPVRAGQVAVLEEALALLQAEAGESSPGWRVEQLAEDRIIVSRACEVVERELRRVGCRRRSRSRSCSRSG